MPLMLQVVQNNYGSGFHSLSFLKNGNTLYMTYGETDASYLLPIGFGVSADGDISVGGVPYHVKTLGSFVRDEDGRPLLKIRIAFCETPLTRYLKLYYTGENPRLIQSERPGASFVSSKILKIKKDLITAPLIGETLNRVDDDYLRYRIEKKLQPTLHLSPSRIISKPKHNG